MSRIIIITGWFDTYDQNHIRTGEKEFGASHGIDEDTMETVIVQPVHPLELGAYYDNTIYEWVIDND